MWENTRRSRGKVFDGQVLRPLIELTGFNVFVVVRMSSLCWCHRDVVDVKWLRRRQWTTGSLCWSHTTVIVVCSMKVRSFHPDSSLPCLLRPPRRRLTAAMPHPWWPVRCRGWTIRHRPTAHRQTVLNVKLYTLHICHITGKLSFVNENQLPSYEYIAFKWRINVHVDTISKYSENFSVRELLRTASFFVPFEDKCDWYSSSTWTEQSDSRTELKLCW